MPDHPYRGQPPRAFWSRAVADGFNASDSVAAGDPLITLADAVVSAGSCFAANLVPYLESAGFTYVRTEVPHPAFAHLTENLGYRSFSAAYGNIYTARQLRQLLERALGRFKPAEDRWHVDELVIDPFRPGLRYPAQSDGEFDILTAQHLSAVREAFERATVVVFTLGLTEGWESSIDGAVFPACPGTVSGAFDSSRHRFHNFSAAEVRGDLMAFVRLLREVNSGVRILLTVSPVPLVATATAEHVLVATTYSKSVLRVAAQEVAHSEPNVTYFPAYEIVTGPQAPHSYFEADRRNVSDQGVRAVMAALLAHCEGSAVSARQPSVTSQATSPAITATPEHGRAGALTSATAAAIAEAECEEAMSEFSA